MCLCVSAHLDELLLPTQCVKCQIYNKLVKLCGGTNGNYTHRRTCGGSWRIKYVTVELLNSLLEVGQWREDDDLCCAIKV